MQATTKAFTKVTTDDSRVSFIGAPPIENKA